MTKREIINLMTTFGKLPLNEARISLARAATEEHELRVVAAAMAMQGILSNPMTMDRYSTKSSDVAAEAVNYADALLKALNPEVKS
jgi:hypothetical protein